jgi:phenylalanyl-tRNA synthetase beta chain
MKNKLLSTLLVALITGSTLQGMEQLYQRFVKPAQERIQEYLYKPETEEKESYLEKKISLEGSRANKIIEAYKPMIKEYEGLSEEEKEKSTIYSDEQFTKAINLLNRGFAREMALLLDCQLIDEKHFLTDYSIKYSKHSEDKAAENGITLAWQTEKCNRIAGLYISQISNKPSLLSMAHRLLRVDSRPINAIVDVTNYVMFDIGQPMHAFDAEKLAKKRIVVTLAQEGQSLLLLDEQTITVTEKDIVISDGKKPLSLAGVMGGREDAVNPETKSLIIEAGNFDAASIRNTANHFKFRTESSTRFEKSLDPLQTTTALLRFLHLLEKNNISYEAQGEIICLGKEVKAHSIEILHSFIEKKLGVQILQGFIVKTLISLGFEVQIAPHNNEVMYTVKAPSLRAKDIVIPEDLVEEIGRVFGFDKIPHELPSLSMKPSNISVVQKMYSIKQILAYNASAREMCNYALYDEEFLKLLRWHPKNTLRLKNPISEHMTQLVTSLIPNLFKNIYTNNAQEDVLNFFEWNKIWNHLPEIEKSKVPFLEQASLAGIFFDGKKPIDFYHKKHILSSIFTMLGIDIQWTKSDQELAPWYHPYKTAVLVHNNIQLGVAGSANPGFLEPFLIGDAFIFELNGDLLQEIPHKEFVAKPLAKYQDTWLDISMLSPASITVEQLSTTIMNVTSTIFKVELIDFFQKEEWLDKRSITLRFFARDPDKTLSSADIDNLYNHVLKALAPLGVEIR